MNNKLIVIFIFSALLVGFKHNTAPSNKQTGDFAIYLLQDSSLQTEKAKQQPLDSLTLADQPLITIKDIISYDWSDHTITLTKEGIKKLHSFFSTRKSKAPSPFIVVVGKERIYMGNIFIVGAPRVIFDLPYIHSSFTTTLTIYRASDDPPVDVRDSEQVRKALQMRHKLKNGNSK